MAGSDNQRMEIRNGIVDLLRGNTDAGNNVFASRATIPFEGEIPCILVFTPEDYPSESITESHPTNFSRMIRLVLEILVQRSTSRDEPMDNADQIAGQCEDILLPNIYLQSPPPDRLQAGGPPYDTPGSELCDNIRLGPLTESKIAEGLQDVVGLSAEYVIEYTYQRKTGNVDDFETGDVRYNLEGEQAEADETHDRFTIPQ